MLTKLYQLHMAYQKHTGVPTGCASPRPDGGNYGDLCYCAACKGFYVVSGVEQTAVIPAEHWTPPAMRAGREEWPQFVLDIGGTLSMSD